MRELPILTNCGVSSFSNSALFKLRERRFSVRIRVIFSCSEREMTQLHILTRLDAEQHLRSNPASGFVRRSQSSEENFVNCALSLDRVLLSCTGGRLRGGLDFSSKPFYHGFRPLPLLNPGKLLIFRGLGYRSFRFWGNSWQTALTRLLPALPAALSSQNFWNHMDLVTAEHVLACEKQITQHLIQRFQLD